MMNNTLRRSWRSGGVGKTQKKCGEKLAKQMPNAATTYAQTLGWCGGSAESANKLVGHATRIIVVKKHLHVHQRASNCD